MKRCEICGRVYPNSINVCPTCFVDLVTDGSSDTSQPLHDVHTTAVRNENRHPPLIQHHGMKAHVEGVVATVHQQQYYQSTGTKLLNAVFRREDYQFGHTTFATILRVEENVARGYAEESIDLLIFGNVQGTIMEGDVIVADVIRSSGRLVIQRVLVNGSPISLQARIPAVLLRFGSFMILLLIGLLIYSIASGQLLSGVEHIMASVMDSIHGLLIVVIAVWLCWKLLTRLFKG